MTNTTSITLNDGTNVTINHELLQEYRKRTFEILSQEAAAKDEFKAEVEALADATKIPKAKLGKYLKTSYKAKIKDAQDEVDLFGLLDDIAKA